jgi:hypothetical protein
MVKFTLTHEIQCDVPGFWKVFFDKEFNEELFRRVLSFPDWSIVELREGEKDVYRKVRGTPKLNMPGPVAKLIGPNMTYTEEGTLDRATNTWRWKMIPSSMADKIHNSGVLRVEPLGEGKCRRISEISMEAKVFGLGGVIESTGERDLRDGWEKSAVFMNRWIGEGRAK